MNVTEFSNQFDILFNNITSNQAPGLNEYEKSVLLTKAQEEIVKNYFNPKGNKYQEGFDGSPKRQMDFSNLVVSTSLSVDGTLTPTVDYRALCYKLPTDIFFIVNEEIVYKDGITPKGMRQVLALTYQEYVRLMSKPFKEPMKWQAWRLITNKTSNAATAELIITSADATKFSTNTKNYIVRYVKHPAPIILIDLTAAYGESLSINGKTTVSECELSDNIHDEILQRAVELAKVAWAGDPNQIQIDTQSGQRSE